jgi:hypothetical protein
MSTISTHCWSSHERRRFVSDVTYLLKNFTLNSSDLPEPPPPLDSRLRPSSFLSRYNLLQDYIIANTAVPPLLHLAFDTILAEYCQSLAWFTCLHEASTMANEWDPAKYVIEELDRLYVRADGRVEGGLYPPDYYKYPPDDELYGGNWEDGLQAIECFDWGNGAQFTIQGQTLPQEQGRQEDEENIDWVQKAIDMDQDAGADTFHESSTKAKPQPITSRLTPHKVHQSATSSPSIALQPTHDEPEDVEMQDTSTRGDSKGLSIRTFEAPVVEHYPVISSPQTMVPEKATENVMGTTMEDEDVDKQALVQDSSALRSPTESVSTLQDTDAEAQELLTKVEEHASTYFVEPAKATNSSDELGDSVATLAYKSVDAENPPLHEHWPIPEKATMCMSSREDQGSSTQLSSSKDGVHGPAVEPLAVEFQNSNHDPNTNVQSTTEEAVAETSVDEPQSDPELLALSLSDLLHISDDGDSEHESMEEEVEDKNRMEAEVPAVSNISEELKDTSATSLGNVFNTLPFAVGIDTTHTLENNETDTAALRTDENVVRTVLSTAGNDGSDVTSSSNTKDADDGSMLSPEEPVADKRGNLPFHLQKDIHHPQTQDTTLTPAPSYLVSEVGEMSKTAAAGVPVPVGEPSLPWIPHPDIVATPSGRAVEYEDDVMIEVPAVVTRSSSELSDIPSDISQQALHDLHNIDQGLNVDDDGLANPKHVPEDTKSDSEPYLSQSGSFKLTTHSNNLAVEANKIDPAEMKDENNILAEAPVQEDNKISIVGNTDTTEIDVNIDKKEMVPEKEQDDKMDSDGTTTAIPTLKTLPNVPTTPHTPQASAALVPSTPVSASRFVYSKESNFFQAAPQDLKRPRALIFKSPVTVEKINKDAKNESDEEMPPKKKANLGKATNEAEGLTMSAKKVTAKSVPTITGGRASAKEEKQQVTSDDEVNVEDEDMEAVAAALRSKKDENDDLDGFPDYAASILQTQEKFQFSASDGLPAHPKGNMGTKLSRGLLAAAAATTSPINKTSPVTTKQTPKSLGAGAFAPPVKQTPNLPVLETALPPGKKVPLDKSLTHSRTDSNSTNASFAELLTPWGRPSTRSESKSAPRPNYNLAIDEDDLDDEGDFITPLRPTSGSKATKAKVPLKAKHKTAKKVSKTKKLESRKKTDSKKKRGLNIDGNSNIGVEGNADNDEAAEAFLQLALGPEAISVEDDVSETDLDKLLAATMFQKSSAKARGRFIAREPSASKRSTANASTNDQATIAKTTLAAKSPAAKHTPASNTKATAASKTSVKDTPALTAKATAASKTLSAKAAKSAKATPPTKSRSTPQSTLAATPSTASPARNKYGFTTKTNTRANTRSQALPPAAPAVPPQPSPALSMPKKNNRDVNAARTSGNGTTNDEVDAEAPKPAETSVKKRTRATKDVQKNGMDATPIPPDASSTLSTGTGTGTGTGTDFGTKTTKVNAEAPKSLGTPLKDRTRAGKVEKEKTKGATTPAPTKLDAPSSASKTKDTTPKTSAVTANGASDTLGKGETAKPPVAPLAKCTRAGKAEEDETKEDLEKKTTIGKRPRGAGKSSAEKLTDSGKKGERRKSASS